MLKNLFALVGVGFLAIKAYELYQEHHDGVSGLLATANADEDMTPSSADSPVFNISPSL